ncbi:hypothetical protein O1M63_40870 [Streptomyces mirabilis]|nr:hypothetical protein [Streptomyces mirabilis]
MTGGYGRTLPELHVSIAHRGETAVAMARAEGPCGIDIEEVTDRPEGTLAVALTTAERELLASLVHRPGSPRTALVHPFLGRQGGRREARGTGLGGEPKRFEITSVDGDRLTVRTAGEEYRVRHCALTTPRPSAGPDKEYVVAWTAVNDQENEDDH